MSVYENKVIVIGSNGYIGSHLVENLLKNNNEVYLVDDNSSGRFTNLKGLFPMNEIPPVLNIDNLKAYPKIPIIYHLGTPSSYAMFDNNKHLYSYTIKDFLTVLEYCRRWGSRLIYASTASMYWGNSIPFKETMNIYPKDLYSECSYQMERLCNLYSNFGVKSLGLRLFNVYGGRERYKGDNASLISRFVSAVSGGTIPKIYGDGRQTRDFINIKDVIDALMLSKKAKFDCDVLNIGSGKSYTLNETIELINDLMSSDVQPEYITNPVVKYIDHSLADISMAKSVLKFNPTVKLEDGIRSVIESSIYKEIFEDE
jgi:UDP-glucose 4-epimerase